MCRIVTVPPGYKRHVEIYGEPMSGGQTDRTQNPDTGQASHAQPDHENHQRLMKKKIQGVSKQVKELCDHRRIPYRASESQVLRVTK